MILRTGPRLRTSVSALAAAALLAGASACSRDGEGDGPVRLEGDAIAGECGRACLIGLLDSYLQAVVDHAPDAAPLADDFRGTQNGAPTAPGEGVWATVTALGELQRRYADEEAGEAGYVGLIGEGNSIAIVSLRIRAEGRTISEAEWVIVRDDMPLYNPAGFTANPPPDRMGPGGPGRDAAPETRDAAIAAVESYYEGIEAADASGVIAFQDCYRFENGSWMVGAAPGQIPVETEEAQPGFNTALTPAPASCVGGFANFRDNIGAVNNRRYFFDAENGVVWAHAVFDRVPGATGRIGDLLPNTYLTNIFRIEDGQIRGIHAVTIRLPQGDPGPGWAARG